MRPWHKVAMLVSTCLLAATGCSSTTSVNQSNLGCLNVVSGAEEIPTTTYKVERPGITALTLNGIPADVEIKVSDAQAAAYSFTAPQQLQSKLSWKESETGGNKELLLTFDCQSSDQPLELDKLPQLTMTIGRGIDLSFDHSGIGSMAVGDTEGPVHATVSGTGTTQIGAVTNLSIDKSGTGEMTVQSASGSVDIDKSGTGNLAIDSISQRTEVRASGTGDVILQGDSTPYLLIDKSGTGDVTFTGHADMADLDSSGTGDITIGSVGDVQQESSGTGDINIG